MAKPVLISTPTAGQPKPVPPLESGDRLTRAEFERRYEAMPNLKKVELIEGVVYIASPVRVNQHAHPHAALVTWLGVYQAATPGTQVGDNSTVRLDIDNEPQPDAFLRLLPEYGGQSRTSEDGYVGREHPNSSPKRRQVVLVLTCTKRRMPIAETVCENTSSGGF